VERPDPGEQGWLVDRGPFDERLLERARAVGVRVLQPAVVRERHLEENGWRLRIDVGGRPALLRAAFLADASGRSAGLPARNRPSGCRTLALYGYWAGSRLPREPRIEAAPTSGTKRPARGTYNTLVFVDLDRYRRTRTGPLDHQFHEWIARSGLLKGARDARLMGRVRIAESTPYLASACVTPQSIKVGDAALAIDPLSSSGVQMAIQGALRAAIVVNTLRVGPSLARPPSASTGD
jgi:flavin-dependent dehydrogenase